jgi:hypothetical protein
MGLFSGSGYFTLSVSGKATQYIKDRPSAWASAGAVQPAGQPITEYAKR